MDQRDSVDRHVAQWIGQLPYLDPRVEAIVTRMQRIVQHVLRRKSVALAAHGLKQWEYELLHELRRRGHPYRATPTDVAGVLGIPATTMTSRLDRAEHAGLVTRALDPTDRRRLLVQLTPAGCTAWENAMAEQDSMEKELIGALSEAEQDALAALLRTVMLEVDAGTARHRSGPRGHR